MLEFAYSDWITDTTISTEYSYREVLPIRPEAGILAYTTPAHNYVPGMKQRWQIVEISVVYTVARQLTIST